MPHPSLIRPDDVDGDLWERRARQKSHKGGAKARGAVDGCFSDWYRAVAGARRAGPAVVEILTEDEELGAINAELERQYHERADGKLAAELEAEISRLERRAALIIRTKATSVLARIDASLDAAADVAESLLRRK